MKGPPFWNPAPKILPTLPVILLHNQGKGGHAPSSTSQVIGDYESVLKLDPFAYQAPEIALGIVCSISVILGIILFIVRYKTTRNDSQSGTQETNYLLPKGSVALFPISMSLMNFSTLSLLLLIPSQVFDHGISVLLGLFANIIAFPIALLVFLPVLRKVVNTSVFDYLSLRFSKSVKMTASLLFIVERIIVLSSLLPLSSFAHETLTWSHSKYICVPVIICAIYVSLTEFRYLLWIETFQAFFIYFGMIAMVSVVIGYHAGLNTSIWDSVINSNRSSLIYPVVEDGSSLTPVFTPWATLFGVTIYAIYGWSLDPALVMRYQCAKTNFKANLSVIISFCGSTLFYLMTSLAGLVVYSAYDAQPLDQNLTGNYYLLLDFFRDRFNWPILQILYMIVLFSCIFSGLSAGLNCLVTVLLDSCGFCCFGPSKTTYRFSSIFFGLIILAAIYVGNAAWSFKFVIFDIAVSFSGIYVGLFILGMFSRYSNSKGCLFGVAAAIITTSGISIAREVNIVNSGRHDSSIVSFDTPIAAGVVLIVGTIFSMIFRSDSTIEEDSELLSPLYKSLSRVTNKISERLHQNRPRKSEATITQPKSTAASDELQMVDALPSPPQHRPGGGRKKPPHNKIRIPVAIC